MISFEVSAIDIILVIAVIVLLILYLVKFSVRTFEEKSFRQSTSKDANPERFLLKPQIDFTECPRGFGNIKILGDKNSVSERCLGCYRICECYDESEQKRVNVMSVKK